MLIAILVVAIVVFELGFYFGVKVGKKSILGKEVRIPWEAEDEMAND